MSKITLHDTQDYENLSSAEQDTFLNEYISLRTRLRSFNQEGFGNKPATDADIESVLILISSLSKNKSKRKVTKPQLRNLEINECIKSLGFGDAMCEYTTRKELNKYIVNIASKVALKNDTTAFYILKLMKHIENDKAHFFLARHNAKSVTSFINITNDELLRILCKVENNIKSIKSIVSFD